MEKKWWFFVDGFMNFMKEEFPKPMSTHFTYDLLKNCINKMVEITESQSEFVDSLEEIIPEVARTDIEYYCNR